jgi:hypothetical protein
MLHMLSYNLVSRYSFLDSHFPLRQRNNLITKRSRDFLQRLASSLPVFLTSAPSPHSRNQSVLSSNTYGK